MPNKTLIFVHIAKTGGLSLRQAMSGRSKIVIPHTADLADWGEKAQSVELAVGHIPYGLHEYMGNRDYEYMTILRHPVERVLSKYFYTNVEYRGDSIAGFMTGHFAKVLSNLSVKQLCGLKITHEGEVGKEHCEQALDNLSKFEYVGFTRNLHDIWGQINAEYSFTGMLGHANKTKQNKLETTSEEAIETISAYNEWDIKLFEEATRLYA